MPSWEHFEQRFSRLEEALQFSRIDGQTGAAGEYWRIAGPPNPEAEDRFIALTGMASAKLGDDVLAVYKLDITKATAPRHGAESTNAESAELTCNTTESTL